MIPFGQDLTPAETRFLEVRLARPRAAPRGMVLGNFAEAVVALALPGSTEAPGGIDRWDLDWESIKIQVKCTTTGSWKIPPSNMKVDGVNLRRRWSDVYVLATPLGSKHTDEWEFYVVPTSRLDEHAKDSVTRSHLSKWGIGAVDTSPLPHMVKAVVAKAPSPPTGA